MDSRSNPHVDRVRGWIVRGKFADGADAWWGSIGLAWEARPGFTSNRSKATHFADEADAHNTAEALRGRGNVSDIEVVKYEPVPRRSSQEGSAGRA